MQNSSARRPGLAALLILLFVAAWSLQTTHGFLLHTDHHDRPICSAEHDQAATHIHDTRYATDGCTLCAFVLANADVFPIPMFSETTVQVPNTQSPSFYQPPALAWATGDFLLLRGPPVA
ncbi:MAG: hypothetical protein LH618_02015 [Saprospiraceae bacterium]|nr:hypothetical protein [Saprospiraceae bacterium]